MPDAPVLGISRWFPDLLRALDHEPQVLVTVVMAKGSVPRDPGARMWVGPTQVIDTIGGGNLEWQAIARARQWLATHSASRPDEDPERLRGREAVCVSGQREVVRYPLGPRLGQCCGGAVWLMFEWLDAQDKPWCQALYQALGSDAHVRRVFDFSFGTLQLSVNSQDAYVPYAPGCSRFHDTVHTAPNTVVVCGAGHVGQAIVRLLGDLPFKVIWLDPREDEFPNAVPLNVQRLVGDAHDVAGLPDDAFWLVLTHNHALDLQLIEAVLQHRRTRFLGMIGSETKLASFRSRLSRQFSPQEIARLQCPIGSLSLRSKEPAVIAISVVAQLLQLSAA